MALSNEQVEAFHELEAALWIADTRGDRAWTESILSRTFTEHGQSGRVYNRAEILDEPIPDLIDIVLPLPDFAIRAVSPTVVLVTYTSIVRGNAHNRVSLWQHNGDRWLLEFHQGTPAMTASVGSPPAESLPARSPINAHEVASKTFSVDRRGYDTAAVDLFLSRLAARIHAGETIEGHEIDRQRFEAARRGYNCTEVDDFLAQLKNSSE